MDDTIRAITPVSLHLYGTDDELLRTLERRIVPWGMLKRAIRLSNKLGRIKEGDDVSEETIDLLEDYVLTFFGGQCTKEELENGAKPDEMFAVLQDIMARAASIANPTLPRGNSKKKKAIRTGG